MCIEVCLLVADNMEVSLRNVVRDGVAERVVFYGGFTVVELLE